MRPLAHLVPLLALLAGPAAGQEGAPAAPAAPASPAPPVVAPAPTGAAAGHAGMHHADPLVPPTPRLLPGYGTGGFPITTRVPAAQAFFSNGMQLAHAFAHDAAVAAMAEAVRLDPGCAMCRWGHAWAAGPTINYGRTPAELAPLAAEADAAARLAAAGPPRERALIEALRRRYRRGGGGRPGDLAFARAMAGLVTRYPAPRAGAGAAPDPMADEIAVMAADAWLMAPARGPDGEAANARLALPLLQAVLARSPSDTGAIHFYIHATEIAGEPALAEAPADRLAALAPRASHLVHMPSHTYYWVGRYHDAAVANLRAVQIGLDDARALGLPPPEGVWGLPYHAHNVVYGLGGALEAGDAAIALTLGRPLVARSQGRADAEPIAQLLAASGYFALARFAPVAEVLALPAPRLPVLVAAWHYARGEARARAGDAAGVGAEAALIRPDPGLGAGEGAAAARTLAVVARGVLEGRAALLAGRPAAAAAAFRAAAAAQESQPFSALSDPPGWYYPVRRDLAAALLAAGDRAGARAEAAKALAYRAKDPGTLALLASIGA